MSNGGGAVAIFMLEDTSNRTYTFEENIMGIIKVSLLVIIVSYIFWKLKKYQKEEEK